MSVGEREREKNRISKVCIRSYNCWTYVLSFVSWHAQQLNNGEEREFVFFFISCTDCLCMILVFFLFFFFFSFIKLVKESGIKSLNHVWFPSTRKTPQKQQYIKINEVLKKIYKCIKIIYTTIQMLTPTITRKNHLFIHLFFALSFLTFKFLTCCNHIQHYDRGYYHIWSICII